MRVESQPAYVLHTRDYSNSSLIVDFITPDYGRVSAVVRGVRAKGKTAKARRAMMQLCVPLLISWMGTTDLKTITVYESRAAMILLRGKSLFSAMYINELMIRLLPQYDEHPQIFSLYEWVLKALSTNPERAKNEHIEETLRRFELSFLECLGYGYDLYTDVESGAAIVAEQYYLLDVERGFSLIEEQYIAASVPGLSFKGTDILDLANGIFSLEVRRTAKRFCRLALQQRLGGKPLKSRELFV